MIIVDSDVLIDALRGVKSARERIDLELRTGRLATTVVSVFELLSGARNETELQKVGTLLGGLHILPVDSRAARTAAEIRRELEAKGSGLAMADYLIAAVCLCRDGLLLTRNRAHFERVPGLTLGRLAP